MNLPGIDGVAFPADGYVETPVPVRQGSKAFCGEIREISSARLPLTRIIRCGQKIRWMLCLPFLPHADSPGTILL